MHRTPPAGPASVDQLPRALGVGTPQQKHQALALAVERVDRRIGEAFPALALVRTGAALFHRQHAVEQQHAAIGPRREAAVVGARDAEVVRSEEHTSELQSLMRISYAVFCLKKKKKQHNITL